MSRAYYNEIDPGAVEWLGNLMAAGLIAPGVIDSRSIVEVRPDDLVGFEQVHFFAGIGGWSYAARLSGWADNRPLWTASCPCQPFSVAGKGAGFDDERDLWPHVIRLARAVRPPVIVGEQVAGKAGYSWLDRVRLDLAAEGYAGRGVDIPACAVDAPHIRQRLYWVALDMADSMRAGRDASAQAGVCRRQESAGTRHGEPERLHGVRGAVDVGNAAGRGRAEGEQAGPGAGHGEGAPATHGRGGARLELADADRRGRERRTEGAGRIPEQRAVAERAYGVRPVGDGIGAGLEGFGGDERGAGGRSLPLRPTPPANDRGDACDMGDGERVGRLERRDDYAGDDRRIAGAANQFGGGIGHNGGPRIGRWDAHDWIPCHDGKARRVADARAPLLVDGVSGRVAIPRPGELSPSAHPEETRWVSRVAAWSGFGNAIVPDMGAEVLAALREAQDAGELAA